MRVALGIRPAPCRAQPCYNTEAEIAEAEIRICFREAKYAAIAHSAGPNPIQPLLSLLLAAKTIDFPRILLHFATWSRFSCHSALQSAI